MASVGSNDTTDNPWTALRQIGENLRVAYAPPEGQRARCDAALLLQATRAARYALEGDASQPGEAVVLLLGSLEKTLRGLLADMRGLEEAAGELAEDVKILCGQA